MKRTKALRLIILAMVGPTVEAWGKVGHEIVANLAYERLSTNAQAAVKNILGTSSGGKSGSPLGAVADWADRVRYTHEYHWTVPLHFIDVHDNEIDGACPAKQPGEHSLCTFDYTRDCEEDMCVAGAIANYSTHIDQSSFIRGGDDSKWHVKESLMFVTHFVGDIHQPLHCARKSDKGGNTIHVHFDVKKKPSLRGSHRKGDWNLHSVWDDGLIERALVEDYNGTRSSFESDLRALIQKAAQTGDLEAWLACADGRNKTCTSLWAEESLEDAMSWAYRNQDDSEVVEGSILSLEYYESRMPVVRRRIAAAGVRLAATLELVLSNKNIHFPGQVAFEYIVRSLFA